MTILALDTTTNRGTIALEQDGELLLDEVFPADRSQSSRLFPMLECARDLASRIDLIALGLGPGSYAGARIAIAAAIGFARAMGAELVGLPSVAALETEATHYLAIGDARLNTFYFTRVEQGVCVEGPILVDAAGLDEKLAKFPDHPVFSPASMQAVPRAVVALPRAAALARLAALGRSIVQRGDLEPLYLRDPHITTPKARTPLQGPRS